MSLECDKNMKHLARGRVSKPKVSYLLYACTVTNRIVQSSSSSEKCLMRYDGREFNMMGIFTKHLNLLYKSFMNKVF